MHLLLVEDEPEISQSLTRYLVREGFVVDCADCLEVAKAAVLDHQFDLVLLDRRLPDGEGKSIIEFCRKREISTRFILVTALGQVDEIVDGLSDGAIDYVSKPFEPQELLARIRNALRFPLKQQSKIKEFGALRLNSDSGDFRIDGELLFLTRAQRLVLEALMQRPGSVMSREALFSRVYGYDGDATDNSLEALIYRLRKALGSKTDKIQIQSVRGIGYALSSSG